MGKTTNNLYGPEIKKFNKISSLFDAPTPVLLKNAKKLGGKKICENG